MSDNLRLNPKDQTHQKEVKQMILSISVVYKATVIAHFFFPVLEVFCRFVVFHIGIIVSTR